MPDLDGDRQSGTVECGGERDGPVHVAHHAVRAAGAVWLTAAGAAEDVEVQRVQQHWGRCKWRRDVCGCGLT